MKVSVISYGGIITSWKAKGRDGKYEDVVLGFDLRDYEIKALILVLSLKVREPYQGRKI